MDFNKEAMHPARTITVIALAVLLSAATAFAQAETPLKVGDSAPSFTLPSATRDSIGFSGVRLADILGKNVIILAFYPADWSGGCTKEMCSMRDSFGDLAGLGATVYGISGDYVFSHFEWAKHLNLPFTLLSDHTHDVARAYRSYNPQSGYNLRTVYVIDRQGTIAYIDLGYKSGSADSFDRLKEAVRTLR